jgi:exosortase K
MTMPDIMDKKTICIGVTVVTALVLKLLYPLADTEDLKIFVQPTAEIVSIGNNESFIYSADGFYFPAMNVLIDKSCSGFNFFIIALCVFASIVPYHYLSKRHCVLLMGLLVFVTYAITICVNASRIITAIFLLRLQTSVPWVTQPWVHEAEGALVYLFALLGAYLIITHYLDKFNLRYAKRSQPVVAAGH